MTQPASSQPQADDGSPPAQQTGDGAPGDPTTRAPLDVVSVLALVFSFLGGLLGLVLGIVGIVRTRGGQRRGRGLAVAAVVVSTIVTLLSIGVVIATVVLGQALLSSNVQNLSTGDCVEEFLSAEGGAEEVGDVPVVDCAEPHTYEVFATFDTTGEEFPGDAALAEEGTIECLDRLVTAAQEQGVDDTQFDVLTLWPSQAGWELQDDRTITCLLYRLDGTELVGDPVLGS